MKHIVVMLLLAGSLVGCATGPSSSSSWLVTRENSKPKSCEPLTSDQELVLSLSQEMANSGRLHAALANLERLPISLPEARLRKAQLLRRLGRSEAEELYADLTQSCLVAEAHHGLGQIEVARKNYPEALEHLRKAAGLSPANDAMRNDLGVAYLNMQRLPEANFELMTAMELNEADTRAVQNMLTLLIYQDKWHHARDLVNRKKLTTEQFRDAEKRARRLQAEHAALLAEQSKGPAKQQPKVKTVPAAQPQVNQARGPVAAPVPAAAQPVARPAAAPARAARPAPVQTPVAPRTITAPVQQVSAPAQPKAVAPAPSMQRPRPVQAQQPVSPARPIGVQANQSAVGGVRGVQRAPSAGARAIEPITGY